MIAPSIDESRTRDAFAALMWALSYPGRAQALAPDAADARTACGRIADALLDSETTCFAGDPEIGAAIAHSGARRRSAAEADYAFFTAMEAEDLQAFANLSSGDPEYPDRGATVIIALPMQHATERMRLRGPGIDGIIEAELPAMPAEFWATRRAHIRYPLGVDIFFVRAGAVIGMPRTTEVTACM
jgi:alpha-D-ribose 1-methylphosphonate 5-triphosphate synthase subunit PhnH